MIYESNLFLILLSITILSILMMILGRYKYYNSGMGSIGVFILIVNSLFGWMLIGSNVSCDVREYNLKKSDVYITNTNSNVIVETPLGVLLYNKKINFDNIDDNTIFILSESYNLYNSVIGRSVYYMDKTTLNKEEADDVFFDK